MRLSRGMKKRIKEERDKMFDQMSIEGIDEKEWTLLKKKYDGYDELLKNDWKVTPDTLVKGGFYIGGILLVLYFEKADIITSKALSQVFKGI